MKNISVWNNKVLQVDLVYKLNILNNFQLPQIKNIDLNICSKSVIENPKNIIYLLLVLKLITNQVPTICKLKKSVAMFKLRKGMLIGSKLKLTNKNPNFDNFLYSLIFFIIPNIKKLKLSKINSNGCTSFYINDILLFPQINSWYSKFPKNQKNFHMTVNFSIKNGDITKSKLLFTGLQIPVY